MIFIPLWQRLMVALVVAGAILFAMPNLFYSRVEMSNDARTSIEEGISSADIEAQASVWPSWLPSRLINLGLDLRGGAHLLAEVQVCLSVAVVSGSVGAESSTLRLRLTIITGSLPTWNVVDPSGTSATPNHRHSTLNRQTSTTAEG